MVAGGWRPAAGGLIVASAGRVFGVARFSPIVRLAVLEATVAVLVAAVCIVPDVGHPERLVPRDRPAAQPFLQRLAAQELEDEPSLAPGAAHVVDGHDVGVVEARGRAGLDNA